MRINRKLENTETSSIIPNTLPSTHPKALLLTTTSMTNALHRNIMVAKMILYRDKSFIKSKLK